jgi:lipid-binding SYLF domain-containing protein
MKLFKFLFALVLVSMIAFSCKSDKKAGDVVDDAVEATSDAASDAADAVEETADDAVEAVSDAADEAVEAVSDAVEEVAPKQITVVFPKDTKLQNEVKASLAEFAKSNPKVESHLHTAYAFAFFPKITKGGLGIGGAGGKGLVFDNKTVVGESKLAQATFGLQAGGQQYMEIILFEDKPALDRFTAGKVKFSGQASAVALKDGASADINYQDGVAIFTKTIGGLMAEASVGGQSFKYTPGIN